MWNDLQCEKSAYLHQSFLKSIEDNHPDITFYYIVLVDKKEIPIAFASINIINFHLDIVSNNFESFAKKVKRILRKIAILPNKKPLKLLISGNTFVSGEHGLFIKDGLNKQFIIDEIAKAILHLVQNKTQLKIDAFLLKDFVNESLPIMHQLKEYKYHPFSAEPNMVLKLSKNWTSFEDYLADLKTKFRVKAKKAFALSRSLQIDDVTSKNIDDVLPKMTALYDKVASKAAFNLATFNLNTYINLKQNFGENYILKTYSLNGKIVGFLSGIITQNTLDAHFVGIDYQLNRQHAIYQRMLYNYIEIAIERKLTTLNFGRTASEIKSSVGAIPQDLTMYLRHKKRFTNKILKLFLQRIQPSPFHQKFPFKKKTT